MYTDDRSKEVESSSLASSHIVELQIGRETSGRTDMGLKPIPTGTIILSNTHPRRFDRLHVYKVRVLLMHICK